MNFTGPITEPCGTLHVSLIGFDIPDATQKDCVRSDKYDFHQSSALLTTPNRLLRTSSSTSWSTVSNRGANSKTIAETFAASIARTMSLCTMVIAVSVEWYCLYADCLAGSRWCALARLLNLSTTRRSLSFDIKTYIRNRSIRFNVQWVEWRFL